MLSAEFIHSAYFITLSISVNMISMSETITSAAKITVYIYTEKLTELLGCHMHCFIVPIV